MKNCIKTVCFLFWTCVMFIACIDDDVEEGTVDLRSTQAEATLYYHKATADIKFNGYDKFKKEGDILIARGGSKIHALINPVNLKAADIQAYEIGLTDSKGNTALL